MPLVAITRAVSRSIGHCQLTHLAREPIDYARAVGQHHSYQAALRSLGCEMVTVPAADEMPDAVFVEDTAIVLDEVAVMTRPGAESRRGELAGVEAALSRYRRIDRIRAPATLDGGDVLRVGRTLFVGRSSRTNDEGVAQLRALSATHGYSVEVVGLRDCLHLKSGVSAVGERVLLGNSAWVDRRAFGALTWIEVDPSEPNAANGLWIGDVVIYPSAYPRTARILRAHLEKEGMSLHLVDADELAKAEGGVTCCSVILSSP